MRGAIDEKKEREKLCPFCGIGEKEVKTPSGIMICKKCEKKFQTRRAKMNDKTNKAR